MAYHNIYKSWSWTGGHADGETDLLHVAMREARDATLGMPRLILPSIQVNMRGGHMPEPESNGTSYLKLPVNTL